jgi:hypothetical protein
MENPLLKQLTLEQRMAMMRQQAPKPPDISTFRQCVCTCGNRELEVYEFMKYDPLQPAQFLRETKRRCKKCGLEPQLLDGVWKWVEPVIEPTEERPAPEPESKIVTG